MPRMIPRHGTGLSFGFEWTAAWFQHVFGGMSLAVVELDPLRILNAQVLRKSAELNSFRMRFFDFARSDRPRRRPFVRWRQVVQRNPRKRSARIEACWWIHRPTTRSLSGANELGALVAAAWHCFAKHRLATAPVTPQSSGATRIRVVSSCPWPTGQSYVPVESYHDDNSLF